MQGCNVCKRKCHFEPPQRKQRGFFFFSTFTIGETWGNLGDFCNRTESPYFFIDFYREFTENFRKHREFGFMEKRVLTLDISPQDKTSHPLFPMWGTITRFLIQAVKYGSPFFTGYFTNDVATTIGKVTGAKADSSGRAPWYVLLLTAVVLGGLTYLLISLVSSFLPKSKRK